MIWKFHYRLCLNNSFLDCGCNHVGSTSNECNSDGQCSCKPNYYGKKCTEFKCQGGFHKRGYAHMPGYYECEGNVTIKILMLKSLKC